MNNRRPHWSTKCGGAPRFRALARTLHHLTFDVYSFSPENPHNSTSVVWASVSPVPSCLLFAPPFRLSVVPFLLSLSLALSPLALVLFSPSTRLLPIFHLEILILICSQYSCSSSIHRHLLAVASSGLKEYQKDLLGLAQQPQED